MDSHVPATWPNRGQSNLEPTLSLEQGNRQEGAWLSTNLEVAALVCSSPVVPGSYLMMMTSWCKRGDKMQVKIDNEKPRSFCGRATNAWNKPTKYYPAISKGTMKLTYIATKEEGKTYPDKGAVCFVECAD